jgi:hypothetical protein
MFDSRRRLGIFLFTTAPRPALWPTQPPIQWVPETPSAGVKRPGREDDHSFPSTSEVKNAWSYTSTPTHLQVYLQPQFTNFIKQSLSWEIHRLLWNMKNHYRVYMNLPLAHVLSQLNPAHTVTLYFLRPFHTVSLSAPRSLKRYLPWGCPTKILSSWTFLLTTRVVVGAIFVMQEKCVKLLQPVLLFW